MQYPLPIAHLIDAYMKLPGIGEKTATRLAFYTMDMPQEDVEDFARALIQVKKISINVQFVAILPKKISVIFVLTLIVIKQRLWWLNSLKM